VKEDTDRNAASKAGLFMGPILGVRGATCQYGTRSCTRVWDPFSFKNLKYAKIRNAKERPWEVRPIMLLDLCEMDLDIICKYLT
jgi:hypothetical protein